MMIRNIVKNAYNKLLITGEFILSGNTTYGTEDLVSKCDYASL